MLKTQYNFTETIKVLVARGLEHEKQQALIEMALDALLAVGGSNDGIQHDVIVDGSRKSIIFEVHLSKYATDHASIMVAGYRLSDSCRQATKLWHLKNGGTAKPEPPPYQVFLNIGGNHLPIMPADAVAIAHAELTESERKERPDEFVRSKFWVDERHTEPVGKIVWPEGVQLPGYNASQPTTGCFCPSK